MNQKKELVNVADYPHIYICHTTSMQFSDTRMIKQLTSQLSQQQMVVMTTRTIERVW
jgi:hypothetical protein